MTLQYVYVGYVDINTTSLMTLIVVLVVAVGILLWQFGFFHDSTMWQVTSYASS